MRDSMLLSVSAENLFPVSYTHLHRGRLILLGPDGDVQLALGDIHEPFYLRSAAKPLQAIGSMKAGAPLRGSQVAIACGSHRGTFEQMRACLLYTSRCV